MILLKPQINYAAVLLAFLSLPIQAGISLERSLQPKAGESLQNISALIAAKDADMLGLDAEHGNLIEFRGNEIKLIKLSGDAAAFKSEKLQGLSYLQDGRLLVSNAGDDAVSLVDAAGKLLKRIVAEGSAAGSLNDPAGLAWSANRRLYVADRGNQRISVFGDDGVFIRNIGNTGVPEGQRLSTPLQVFVDAAERVYVLDDSDRGRVSIYDDEGELLKHYNSASLGKITQNQPALKAIAIDNTGLLYIADNDNGRVYQLDWQADKMLASFGSKGAQRGQFKKITALAVLPNNQLAVADSGNKKIDIYQLAANSRAELEQRRLATVGFERSLKLNCGLAYRLRGGSVLCLDTDAQKVTTFNASGRVETAFKGEFNELIAAAVNDQDVIILDDETLKIYRLDGGLRYKVGASGSGDGQFDSPRGVFVRGDKIYVADTGNRRIQVFSKDGIFLNRISNPGGDQPEIFSRPSRVVVDANENMYVLEQDKKQVLVFAPDHHLLYKIGGTENAPRFEDVYDIAVDADNTVYILAAVSGNRTSVQVYDGPRKVIAFGASNEQAVGMDSPVSLSVAPERKTIVSVFDQEKQALINYKYMQLPARLGGLEIKGSSETTQLSWQKVPGSYISRYKVYAARSAAGPFRYLTDVDTTEAVAKHNSAFTNTHYRVSAVSGFGVEGEASNVREDSFQAGYALFREFKYEQALAIFSRSYSEDQSNGELLKYLGLTAMELGKVDDAVAYFRQLSQLPGYQAEGRNLHVRSLVGIKDYVAAKAVIDQVIADNSASVDTIVYCGELSLMLGDAIGAVSCLEDAIKQQPDNIKAHFLLGKAYVKLGIPDKGLAEFKTAVALEPADARVWYQNGSVLQEMARHKEAIASLKKALELKPGYADAQLALAHSYLELKQYAEVRNLAIRLAGQKETAAEGQYLLGITAQATGKDGEALLALNKATRADERYTAAWLALADTYIKMKQHDKVRAALQSASDSDVDSFTAAQRLGLHDYQAGDYLQAAQSLERAAALRPDDYEIHYKLADAQLQTGAYKQADAAASQALRLKPEAWQALLLQANIANKQGKNGKAIDLVKQAMAKQKNSAVLTTRLGALYAENSMYDQAKSALEKAALLDATSAQPHALLGALYLQRRSYDAAIAALDKAVSLDATAENKLALDTAYAEKKKSQEFKSNAPRIVLKDIVLERVFSAAYKQYAEKPVGVVLVQNNSSQDYGDLKLSFAIKGYMDFPATVDIKKLPANSEQKIELHAAFNNKILEIDEDTGVQAEIAINFIRDGQNDAISISQPMTIYGKNAIVWADSKMIGSFVTPKDDLLRDFVRTAINENKPKADAIDNSLLTAMTLFDVFGAHGIKYVVDPNNPYSKISETSIDYVQFSRETLKLKSGDCDDLSVLLSASLENLGIETAILDVPGHLLMMFNTGLPESQRGQISLDDDLLVIRDGQVWVPIEATMLGQTFAEAWSEGARKYHQYAKQNKLDIIALADAWSQYKPVTLKPASYSVSVPQKSHVAPMVLREKNLLLEKNLDRLVGPYRAMVSSDPGNLKARMQIAIIYARYGLYQAAEREFDEIMASMPDNSAVHNNRGNIYFSKGDFERALENYSYAEKLAANDAGIKMNLSMAHYQRGDLRQASAKYEDAAMIDASIAKKYQAYAKLLSQ